MSKQRKDIPIVLVKDISANRDTSILTRSRRFKKTLFGLAGVLSLILAILGIVVPGLPCTPFALLSAAMFAKSSDSLYNKLLNSKILGARIRNYQRKKGITKKGKIKVLIFMWVMVLISTFIIIKPTSLRAIVLTAGLIGAIVVWFFVPEGRESCGNTTSFQDQDADRDK